MLRTAVLVALVLGSLGPAAAARADEPTLAATTATLTILSGAVQRVTVGSAQAEFAADGANLQAGDRVITGPTDRALVTFLDGTTLTVEPGSDIVVQQADVGGPGDGSTINIHINLGTVWARVVRLADPGSSFSLSSNTATAVVHDGLPGAQQKPDGTFVCWTFDGDMNVTNTDRSSLVLHSHETTAVLPHNAKVGARPVNLNASTLRITASASVLPLIQMPDKARVAGFVAPGIEVNQVFGSFTDGDGGSYTIEVPGGETGPFNLVLEGARDDTFTVDIQGLAGGKQAYSERLSGTITTGERLISSITQQVDAGSSQNTATVRAGSLTPLVPLVDVLPGKIMLSQAEIDSLAAE